MNKSWSTVVGCVGLMGVCAAAPGATAFAAAAPTPAPVQEPMGFVSGGIIGGFAAGPFGAVIGAGIGTWLGNRVHRAGEAKAAEARAAELMGDKNELIENNRTLTAQLTQLSQAVEAAKSAKADPAPALKGLRGDVLFTTGSSELPPDMVQQVESLAKALSRSESLKIRIDGYADPRGTEESNLALSEARANAVRDILLASGVKENALEVNAYGKERSEAKEGDSDAYALERRVRLTIEPVDAAVAQVGEHE